jgi:hypothetical protein
MADSINLALYLKAGISVLLIIGGCIALFIGRQLYSSGVGLTPDGTEVELKKIKASLKTVGSTVMATSVAWGALAVWAAPTLDNNSMHQSPSLSIPKLDWDYSANANSFTCIVNGKKIGSSLLCTDYGSCNNKQANLLVCKGTYYEAALDRVVLK